MQVGSRIKSSFGEILKFLRKKDGFSQIDLAEELGCRQGYISALEKSSGSIDKYREVMENLGYDVIIKINVDVIKKGENPLMFTVDA